MKTSKNKLIKLLCAVLTVLLIGAMNADIHAQTLITIGTGSGAPSVGMNPGAGIEACSPYGVNVSSGTGGKKWQGVYTAAMINTSMTNAGFAPGSAFIHTIGFDISALVSSGFSHSGYTVKMANIAPGDLSGGYYTGAMTTVYGPATFAPTATGFFSLTINTPFLWDGTSNLCVEVCYTHPSVGLISTYGGCRYTSVGGNNHMGFAGGSGGSCSTVWPGTGSQTNRLCNMRLTVTSATPCSGAPAAASISPASVNVCPSGTSTLVVAGLVSGSGYTYQWQESTTAGGPYTNVTGGSGSTTASYTTPQGSALPAVPTYYVCQVTCANSGITTQSSEAIVGLNSFLDCYCKPSFAANNAGTRGITQVILNGSPTSINNPTTCNGISPFYSLYTTPVADLTIGTSYTLQVKVGSLTTYVRHGAGAFIDFDRNGAFEATEFIGGFGNLAANGTGTINFTVPAAASAGVTAMRVIGRFISSTTPVTATQACASFTGTNNTGGAGECEDYRVLLIPSCVAPTVQPSNFAYSNIVVNGSNSSADISFDRGNGGGIIIVARAGTAPIAPQVGNTYNASSNFTSGDITGTGSYVVYNGTDPGTVSLTVTGLTNNINYYFYAYEYDGTCYNILSPGTGIAPIPICQPPTQQVADISAVSTTTTATLTWTEGNGDATFILLKEGAVVNAMPAQTVGYSEFYHIFGQGSQLGTGNYVVKASGGSSVTVVGLTPSKTYHYAAYTYYSATNCYLFNGVAGNFTTASCAPALDASALSISNIQPNEMTLSWVRGSGDRVIVLARQGASVNADPAYFVDYSPNANPQFGQGAQVGINNWVVYDGTGTSITVTGLAPGVIYHFAVYEYNSPPQCYSTTPARINATTLNPMYLTSLTTVQNTADVPAGSTAQHVISVQIATTGGLNPSMAIMNFTMNTNGSTDPADIAAARLYYTGTSGTFTSTNQFGSVIVNPGGTMTFTGNTNLAVGTNYFWLAYDIHNSPPATMGNYVDAECTSVVIDGIATTPAVTAPAGSRKIIPVSYCQPAEITGYAACDELYGGLITQNYGIGLVRLGEPNNTAPYQYIYNNPGCEWYVTYADHSVTNPFGTTNSTVNQGLTYSVYYSRTGSDYASYNKIWVDWNNNGVFGDAGELIFNRTIGAGDNNGYFADFTVPWTASPGNHKMRVYDSYGNTNDPCATNQGTILDFNIVVLSGCIAPAFTLQPAATTACAGESVTFYVTATGTGLQYQWQHNGNDIPAANSDSYTVNSVTTGDGGVYTCVASNNCGMLTSDPAMLTINEPPVITVQPTVTTTVCEGESVTFSVSAAGTDLQYQWQAMGIDIPGANSSAYTINPVTYNAGNGMYRCVVSNSCGTAVSEWAWLTVNLPPEIIVEPAGATMCTEDSYTLTVSANGTLPLTYAWYHNGNIVGTDADYVITSAVPADAGNYYVVVSNMCSPFATSQTAVIVVNEPPAIAVQPVAETVCTGSAVTFNVAVTGTLPFTYQWQQDGIDIPGASGSSYTIDHTTAGDEGDYTCVITNICGASISDIATLTVIMPVFTCPSPATVGMDVDECYYTVPGTGFDPTVLNNNICPDAVFTHDYALAPLPNSLAGAVFSAGVATVTWTLTNHGIVLGTCSYTITVNDDQPPVIDCPPDIVLCYEQAGDPIGMATATDNCGTPVISSDLGVLVIGDNYITWTATDMSGNNSVCMQKVALSAPVIVNITQSNLATFCQGSEVMLSAESSEPGVTYLWSTGENTPSIEAAVPGTYDITVTNPLGCNGYGTISVNVDASSLLSSYIVLARKEIKLEGVNVYDLGVGVKDDKGKIKVKHQSQLTDPGTFARADKVEVDNSSVVNDIIPDPVNLPWPEFQFMPYHGGSNIHVPNYTTMYLNDTLYKEIKVGKNATVIFTQPIVNIEKKLKLEDGATVRFATCATVRIKDKLETKKNAVVNPDDVSIVFYMDHDVNFGEGNYVAGIFYLGDHKSADTVKHRLNVHDSKIARRGIYKVMFLAEKVEVKKNNYLYPMPYCNFCNPNIPKDLATSYETENMQITGEPLIENYPNPFSDRTNILFILPQDDEVTLQVFDLTGKLLHTLYEGDAAAAQEYNVEFDGSELPTGIYIYRMTTTEGVFTGKMILNRD